MCSPTRASAGRRLLLATFDPLRPFPTRSERAGSVLAKRCSTTWRGRSNGAGSMISKGASQ